MTKEEILLKLIERKEPMATAVLGCTYDHGYNGGCAIGCLIESELAGDISGIVRDVIHKLPEPIAQHGVAFLSDLQFIHDGPNHWVNWKTAEPSTDGYVWNHKGIELINKMIRFYKLKLPLLKITP